MSDRYCYRCGLPAHRGSTEWCILQPRPWFYRVRYCYTCGASVDADPAHRYWDCPLGGVGG